MTSFPVGAAQLRVAEQRFDRSALDSANVGATDTGQVTGKRNSDGHAAFLFIFNKSAQFCFGRERRPGDRLGWGRTRLTATDRGRPRSVIHPPRGSDIQTTAPLSKRPFRTRMTYWPATVERSISPGNAGAWNARQRMWMPPIARCWFVECRLGMAGCRLKWFVNPAPPPGAMLPEGVVNRERAIESSNGRIEQARLGMPSNDGRP